MTPVTPAPLMRATELTGLPVVDVDAGEVVAEVKDVLYSPEDGRVTGFTLNKHGGALGGLLRGPMKELLHLDRAYAVGRDAVTVAGPDVLQQPGSGEAPRSRNVLGNQVLTDGGDTLGVVSDIVLRGGVIGVIGVIGAGDTRRAGEVVGYQVSPSHEGKDKDAPPDELVPLPYTLAVSGTHLVVPATVRPFVTSDLSGFGGAVEDFRAQLEKTP